MSVKAVKPVKITNTHVPDKVYAYSLQVKHMMYELLSCKNGDAVSVEVFEDVGVQKADGTVEAVQTKSALSNRNPVSNRAIDLWKTLSNWLSAVQENEMDVDKTKFRLLITVDKHGEIVDLFNNSNTFSDAQQAWEKAKDEFYDSTGVEKDIGSEYAEYVRHFFLIGNKEKACKIIEKFQLNVLTKSHMESLYELFIEKTIIGKESIDILFIYMLGWIEKSVAEMVEIHKPMVILYHNFKNEMTAKYREINQRLSLIEIAPKPSHEMIIDELDALRIYVEQLDIINSDYTDIVEAISDYLRASSNRTIWAQRGDFSDDTMDSFSEELIRIWQNKKKIIDITQSSMEDKKKGQLLLFQCKDSKVDAGTLSTPNFFVSGCYHALADEEVIGWHPKYKEELMKRRDGSGKP